MAQVAGFAELEAILNEFVVTTDNQRKKQIGKYQYDMASGWTCPNSIISRSIFYNSQQKKTSGIIVLYK